MKSMLVIGMGKFGTYLAKKLLELGCEVMVIDKEAEVIEGIAHLFPDAQIGDCTRPEVIGDIGVDGFDVCFVAIDENFQSSLEITSLLNDMGAKCIVSKSSRYTQQKFLKQNGAKEVIFPDKDIAERVAIRYSANNVFDYIPIGGDQSLFELPIREDWVDKTILDIDVRRQHSINILSIKNGDDVIAAPSPDYTFRKDDHIIVIGKTSDVLRFSSKLK